MHLAPRVAQQQRPHRVRLRARELRTELQVRSHPTLGTFVAGLTESPIESFSDALELLDFGAKRLVGGKRAHDIGRWYPLHLTLFC